MWLRSAYYSLADRGLVTPVLAYVLICQYLKLFTVCNIDTAPYQSSPRAAHCALSWDLLKLQINLLNSHKLDRRLVSASYVICVGLFLVHCYQRFHSSDFFSLVHSLCIIFWWNHKRDKFWKPRAYRGSVCPLEVASLTENPVLQALRLQNLAIYRKLPNMTGVNRYKTQYITCAGLIQGQNAIDYFEQGIPLISGFRRDVDKICALLGYYAA